MSPQTPNILFVCLGNICRSPMAEAVFKHTYETEFSHLKLGKIDSCGTSSFHIGNPPDTRSVKKCKENGVKVEHTGRQLSTVDFQNFDYILGMDEENISNIKKLLAQSKVETNAKISLLGDYDPEGNRIIKDPYYGGEQGFEINFQQVKRSSRALLEEIAKNLN